MQQLELGPDLCTKSARKHEFLKHMQQVIPMKVEALIAPCGTEGRAGSPSLAGGDAAAGLFGCVLGQCRHHTLAQQPLQALLHTLRNAALVQSQHYLPCCDFCPGAWLRA